MHNHIQDALAAVDTIVSGGKPKPKKKAPAKKKKPTVKKTKKGAKKVQTKKPTGKKPPQQTGARKESKRVVKKATKKKAAPKKVQTKAPAKKKAPQAKKAAKRKAPAKKKTSKKVATIPGNRLKLAKKGSAMTKQAKAKKRAKTRASTVSASGGHHFFDGKHYYVDTAFINSLSRFWPEAYRGLSHMGFGEFVAKLPDGTEIEFDKMRGKDFPGKSGRSHQVYDNKGGKGVEKMIQLAEQKGASELVSASVSAAAKISQKQFKGYLKAKKASKSGVGEGISFNDSYNMSTFGIDQATYFRIDKAMKDLYGMFPPTRPRLADLQRINDALSASTVSASSGHHFFDGKHYYVEAAAVAAKAAEIPARIYFLFPEDLAEHYDDLKKEALAEVVSHLAKMSRASSPKERVGVGYLGYYLIPKSHRVRIPSDTAVLYAMDVIVRPLSGSEFDAENLERELSVDLGDRPGGSPEHALDAFRDIPFDIELGRNKLQKVRGSAVVAEKMTDVADRAQAKLGSNYQVMNKEYLNPISYQHLSGSAKLSAMPTPNLKTLNKLIGRGLISADEVVMAIEEALMLKRMNKRLASLIGEKLREVFDIGDVIDVGDVPLVAGMDLQAPQLNMNGTRGDDLIEQLSDAYKAGLDMDKAMAQATPHGRDYQTRPAGAYQKARKQHEERRQKVGEVTKELLDLALTIQDQMR